MKKTIIFILAISIANSFLAQITVTNADMPAVNDTFRLSETANIQGLDPVLTGANFNWNFSTLVPLNQRVDTFVSVGSTPFTYQFFFNNIIIYPNHKASYAISGQDFGVTPVSITEVFNYIKNSSTAYDNVGFGSNINGIPSSTQNIPVDREYEFPMNYNDNHISNSQFDITVPTIGFYGQTMERIDTVDGWGTLDLPNGTYNVLRVKSILNKIDTIYTSAPFPLGFTIPRPEEVEYKWLAAGKGIPLLKVTTIAGVVTQIEYQDDYVFVGVEEISKISKVTVFPNPTNSHLVIDFKAQTEGDLKVKLKDISGREIGVIYNNSVSFGSNKLLIDLTQQSIKAGIYLLEMELDDNSYYHEKIIVVD